MTEERMASECGGARREEASVGGIDVLVEFLLGPIVV